MNPPLKLRHGDTLATLYDKFNAVIDYLARTRIVAGSGIRVSQLPAGQTIESTATAHGGTAAATSGGMFRVTENADGTVTVSEGYALAGIASRNSPQLVESQTLERTDGKNYVVLNCAYIEGERVFYSSLESDAQGGYIAGERLSWPLAVLSRPGGGKFVQLWQGGMIDFNLKYYMNDDL